MTGEVSNRGPISQKELDLEIQNLPEAKRFLYYDMLNQKQIQLMPGKGNVNLEERGQLIRDIKSGQIKPEEEPKNSPYGDIDLEKFHEGGQSSLDSRPDIYELD
ncbi:MAG: hypothetical protein US95_C0051G0005 [Candidatus Woesebacteria bacterium GW2011_GWB1_38_5]|uniref:Uncharacterized protein n=3 Tax=Candidatus Woeseibacteriota TaxID=1752722 RepID=A0A0G0KYZ8_9BACT|nr:MAG: hypothetical protein US75_C0034G0005 [Candidatus Woesebacteria bacterium GW2011_GWC1_38_13]KKQ73636.1 MAG: hypothetical protein US95_C0051G0005 [Candidatus Woesebacteria bacterium GW2011_GWB1_38_5]KKQ83967.1 MAG: hypothetical protein UT06_C0012G0032 [Candidatus Woesebacteria bacterium GW2011_GWA1_38_8]